MGRLRALAAAIVGLACVGQAAALDIKPGLWEQTITMETSGAMPVPEEVLGRMSAEQRAKMEAALGRQAPRTTVVQTCLSKEDIATQNKDPFADQHETGMTCKRSVQSNTDTKVAAKLECSGARGQVVNVDATLEAPDSQTIRGTTQTVRMVDGKPSNIKMVLSSRWLGAECGDKARRSSGTAPSSGDAPGK